MELTIQTIETKPVETKITVPCYLYEPMFDRHHFINESGDLITVGRNLVCLWTADLEQTKKQIHSAWKDSHSCTEAEYKVALDKVLFKVEEVYTK